MTETLKDYPRTVAREVERLICQPVSLHIVDTYPPRITLMNRTHEVSATDLRLCDAPVAEAAVRIARAFWMAALADQVDVVDDASDGCGDGDCRYCGSQRPERP